MYSPRNRQRYHQICNKQIEPPPPPKHILNVLVTLHELCLHRNPLLRAFRIPIHLNAIKDSFSRGEAICQEMSLKATTFQLMQT